MLTHILNQQCNKKGITSEHAKIKVTNTVHLAKLTKRRSPGKNISVMK
jgi:hypothetical protein